MDRLDKVISGWIEAQRIASGFYEKLDMQRQPIAEGDFAWADVQKDKESRYESSKKRWKHS